MHRFLKAINFIEANLNDTFQLSHVSESACTSHYHFLRVFHALTGMTAGTYIRRRRLTKASAALLDGKEHIIELAQDAGFESQAAFSRAFRDMFGSPPASFRAHEKASTFRGQPIITEAFIQHLSQGTITMTPRFEHQEALTFVGLGADFNLTDPSTIATLWNKFQAQKHLIKKTQDQTAYGLCYAPKVKEVFSEAFHYTAALRVNDNAPIPDGMEKIHMNAQDYAVFTHKGPLAALAITNDYIWKTWLPTSGLDLADAPDFERYGDDWNGDTGEGSFEIYVPIVR
ncbi:MAG: AraC family transcriptional regulator [Alphaproteobacteria bacterium]|nr:AraC family transcriptional regulator [Alphaproteobacteria bacterium]